MKSKLSLALALAMAWAPALAQTHTDKGGTVVSGVAPLPNSASGASYGATIGMTDSQILPAAATTRYYLDIRNDSPTATVCVNLGAVATIAGAACTAGEYALPPLWHQSFEASFVPSDAVHLISSAASTPVTVTVD